MKIVIII